MASSGDSGSGAGSGAGSGLPGGVEGVLSCNLAELAAQLQLGEADLITLIQEASDALGALHRLRSAISPRASYTPSAPGLVPTPGAVMGQAEGWFVPTCEFRVVMGPPPPAQLGPYGVPPCPAAPAVPDGIRAKASLLLNKRNLRGTS